MPVDLDKNKTARTRFPIADNIAQRWSPCSFRPDTLTTEQIGSLFEAARWAASSFNDQPWRFIYAVISENPSGFNRILGTLMEQNQAWAREAGMLAIVCASTVSKRTGKQNSKAIYDTGQAVANLCTQATTMGLHVHQMGGFSADAAREVLDIPAEWEPIVALAIGHRGDPLSLAREMQQREFSDRERLPFEEFVFHGTCGQAAFLR